MITIFEGRDLHPIPEDLLRKYKDLCDAGGVGGW